jgi:hypothetical protein
MPESEIARRLQDFVAGMPSGAPPVLFSGQVPNPDDLAHSALAPVEESTRAVSVRTFLPALDSPPENLFPITARHTAEALFELSEAVADILREQALLHGIDIT